MKMNKKGFTLIEMLVVIAIIAVLVAIIIPTVSNATDKAGAAANAANLRAVYAELQTEKLAAVADDTGYVKIEVAADGTVTATLRTSECPKAAKTINTAKDATMVLNADGEPTYGTGLDIAFYAKVAETGKS